MTRVREVLAVTLAFGLLFAVFGITIGYVIWFLDPDSIDAGEHPIVMGGLVGVLGLMSGLGSAVLALIGQSGNSLVRLPIVRAVLWSAVASAIVPLVTYVPDAMVPMSCLMGAAAALTMCGLIRIGRLQSTIDLRV